MTTERSIYGWITPQFPLMRALGNDSYLSNSRFEFFDALVVVVQIVANPLVEHSVGGVILFGRIESRNDLVHSLKYFGCIFSNFVPKPGFQIRHV
ncbi:MAG: hypothetical protein A3A44_02480 [Candidatus Sungbacteria bacterium RIFCSPLOWO2_01_FULL_60_25]|uniref:Uncharacterized protein n=1 Tax=Candidatus Sungbacteria bacterium RIFCSPLOWO2_01_FULL_60_25 TaxID=1802281 RepID=A0A1G2L9K1_9BACT|nr:MAG: hypothetical protein A3A44_02480 [Candidatus Sungbacteria bacterium RIFCSPLOWO2_01_FULL_60_25]